MLSVGLKGRGSRWRITMGGERCDKGDTMHSEGVIWRDRRDIRSMGYRLSIEYSYGIEF